MERTETPVEIPTPQEHLPISDGALEASRAVAGALAEGRQPRQEDIAQLAEAVKAELAARDVILTPKEEKGWKKLLGGLFRGAGRAERLAEGGIDEKAKNGFAEFIDWLPEYTAVVQDLSDKYGFATGAGPKLRFWQRVMGALSFIEGAGPMYLAWRWVNKKFYQDKLAYITQSEQAKESGARTLSDGASQHATTILEAQGSDPGKMEGFKEAYANRKLLERLPWLVSLSALPMGKLRERAVDHFKEQMAVVQKNLNARIANTSLMRDFEFLHDTPAMELFARMERGRWAVTTLIAEHHINIVPRLLATLGAVVARVWDDPIVAAVSVVRLPFLLAASKEHIDQSIVWSREEAKKRAEIERMIGSILVSAEVVKTDDVEEAATKLREALDARDEVLLGKERTLTESEKQHVRVTKAFDVSAPIMSALWRLVANSGPPPEPDASRQGLLARIARLPQDFVRGQIRAGKHAQDQFIAIPDRVKTIPQMSRADWIIKGSNVLESILTSTRTQDILKANIYALVGLYTGTLRTAVLEARRFEDFLGSYETLDRPDGPKEAARIPVTRLPNLDISVRNLSYKDILRGVTLSVPQGSFLTIKGEKGTGKTTLLRALMGLFAKESKAVTYGGMAVDGIKQFGKEAFQTVIGYAPQEPQILPHMTIRENLLLWTRRQVSDEQMRDVLVTIGMEKFADRLGEKHAHFSGGEKRLVGIARALLKNPRVLFLDEPTSNLDAATARQLMETIQRIRRARPEMTVVAVTHDPVFETIAETVVDMDEINKRPARDITQVFVGQADATKIDTTAHSVV